MKEPDETIETASTTIGDEFVNEPAQLAGIEPSKQQSRFCWQRPILLYAFAITCGMVVALPSPLPWGPIGFIFEDLWRGSEFVLPVFAIVFGYTLYCCALLIRGTLNSLQAERLQLAEYLAYFGGMLGVVVQLVSLSHSNTETLDTKMVLGALAPFKTGLLVWGFAITVRWLAEHVAALQANTRKNEN